MTSWHLCLTDGNKNQSSKNPIKFCFHHLSSDETNESKTFFTQLLVKKLMFHLSPLWSNVYLYLRLLYHVFYLLLISTMFQCLSLSQAAVPCFLSFTYLHYDPVFIFISGCCTVFFIFYLSPLCSNVFLYFRLLYSVFYLLLISAMFQCVYLSQAAVSVPS